MTHRRAVWTMVTAAMLWSIAGVVARQVEHAQGFELNFWRSAFNALALLVMLSWLQGPRRLAGRLASGDPALWLSGVCWSVMFTAFMVGLTLTTVANVLVTMSLAPLLTALVARAVLGHRLPPRTWVAIALAGAGIAWMYGGQVRTGDLRHWLGTAVALAVPLAAAVNWTVLQHRRRAAMPATLAIAHPQGLAATADAATPALDDFMPAVLIGAVISALVTLPAAWPLAGSATDIAWLALLGVAQLAVPCLLAVSAARVLSAPEIALLGLLEVVFGVLWAWLGAGEAPGPTVLGGGSLVLLALVANEALALRRRPLAPIAR